MLIEGGARPIEIRFDFDAADEAARQLELAAQSLLEVAAVISQDVPVVAEDWHGTFRSVFDVETARQAIAARTLADDLLIMAANMRAKAVQAAAAAALTP